MILNGKIILLFSFLIKSNLDTNEVNLFKIFRYRELLTYLDSDVLFWQNELESKIEK